MEGVVHSNNSFHVNDLLSAGFEFLFWHCVTMSNLLTSLSLSLLTCERADGMIFYFWICMWKNRFLERYLYDHVKSSNIYHSQEVEANQVSTDDERINKTWYIHTTQYHSALKRREILTPATTWMNLQESIRSKTSQSQKDKYCVIPLLWDTQSSHTHRESRMVEGGGYGELLNRYKKVLEIGCVTI